jgi:hypothetical protein
LNEVASRLRRTIPAAAANDKSLRVIQAQTATISRQTPDKRAVPHVDIDGSAIVDENPAVRIRTEPEEE